MPKYIRTGHLVYIIIIALIILSNYLIIAFGGLDNAGAMMGTASTVSSLILSVIAIVLSLVDVAGQRQSIVDLRETAEKLKKSNDSATDLVKDLVKQMSDFQDMRTQMIESVKESNEWRNELLGEVQSLQEKSQKGDSVKSADFDPIIEKASKKPLTFSLTDYMVNDPQWSDKYLKLLNNNQYRELLSKYNLLTPDAEVNIMPRDEDVMSAIRKEYDFLEKLPYNLAFQLIKKEFNVPRQSVKEVINSLEDNGYIDIVKKEDKVWIKLRDKDKTD